MTLGSGSITKLNRNDKFGYVLIYWCYRTEWDSLTETYHKTDETFGAYRIYNSITNLKRGLKVIDKRWGVVSFVVYSLIEYLDENMNNKLKEWWEK